MIKLILISAFTFSLCFSGISIAQTVEVISSNGVLYLNASQIKSGTKISKKDAHDFIICQADGFIPRAVKVEDILKSGENTFNCDLDPIYIPNLKSKSLVFTKVADPNYLANNQADYGPRVNFENQTFIEEVHKKAKSLGFEINESNALFKEKLSTPDIALACEIKEFKKETRGTSGVKISLMVKWVVFDVYKKKVVLEMEAGAFVNDEVNATQVDNVAASAIAASVESLLLSKEFITLFDETITMDLSGKTSIEIAKVNSIIANNNGELIEQLILSAVSILTPHGHGSGFVVSENGYILSSYHVVEGSNRTEVSLSNGVILPVEIIAFDEKRDVVLLKVSGRGFKPYSINSADPMIGIDVLAIGTPKDLTLSQTVTRGIISGKRIIENQKFIQTDVSINPGNSGCALLNSEGEVIGIVVSKVVGQEVEGLGFVVPINSALEAVGIEIK